MPFDPSYLFFASLEDMVLRSLPGSTHPLIAYPVMAVGVLLLLTPVAVQAVKLWKMIARYRRETRRCRYGD